MPEFFATITLPAGTKYVAVGDAPKLMADARFPEIAGKEWEAPTDPPPQELWGKPELQGWGEPPREYLDRERLRRAYADKLDEAIRDGRIYRRCEITWARLEPGKPAPGQLLPVEEFGKFAGEFAVGVIDETLQRLEQYRNDMIENIKPLVERLTAGSTNSLPRFSIEEMPPLEIIEAAEKVARYFKERNIKRWKVGEIQSRQD
jgi:hypothetical protein